jgi:hypothetical protein
LLWWWVILFFPVSLPPCHLSLSPPPLSSCLVSLLARHGDVEEAYGWYVSLSHTPCAIRLATFSPSLLSQLLVPLHRLIARLFTNAKQRTLTLKPPHPVTSCVLVLPPASSLPMCCAFPSVQTADTRLKCPSPLRKPTNKVLSSIKIAPRSRY